MASRRGTEMGSPRKGDICRQPFNFRAAVAADAVKSFAKW
jgi:hypothetical protein